MADGEAIRARRLFLVHESPAGNVAALQGLSLRIREGEIVSVVGPSGSGKTSLLRCLAGLDRPTAGELSVFGLRFGDAPARSLARYRAQSVGIVRQHYVRAMSPDLTILDLVALRPALLGWRGRERHRRAAALLEEVGLGGRGEARPRQLSGGEQQRVAIAAALAAKPRLLLADEPTGELDAETGRGVLELMRSLAHSEGTTVVLVTHDPEAAAISDRILTLRDGRITTERSGPTSAEAKLVDESGVLTLEPEDRASAGIGDRAFGHSEQGRLVLRGTEAPARPGEPQPPPGPGPRADEVETPVVELRAVSRSYGDGAAPVRAVAELTISFPRGRFHTVAGPSGSGKTTLLHLIAGLERPSSGEVSVLGRALNGLSREQLALFRRDHLAVVPQSPALVPFLSALENVELGLLLRGHAHDDARSEARDALSLVSLDAHRDRAADRLSAGERQRLALARALAPKPDVVLVDEPTANLDHGNAVVVASLLAGAAREHGVTVICATHDATVVAQADRTVKLRSGKVHAEDATAGGARSP